MDALFHELDTYRGKHLCCDIRSERVVVREEWKTVVDRDERVLLSTTYFRGEAIHTYGTRTIPGSSERVPVYGMTRPKCVNCSNDFNLGGPRLPIASVERTAGDGMIISKYPRRHPSNQLQQFERDLCPKPLLDGELKEIWDARDTLGRYPGWKRKIRNLWYTARRLDGLSVLHPLDSETETELDDTACIFTTLPVETSASTCCCCNVL